MDAEGKTERVQFPYAFPIGGFIIGFFFVLTAYAIQYIALSYAPGQDSFWKVIQLFHASNPVLFLVDLAPLILAIAGAIVGKKQREKLVYLKKLQTLLGERSEQLSSFRFRYAELFEKTDDCLFVTTLSGEVLDMNWAGMNLLRIDMLLDKSPSSRDELVRLLKKNRAMAQSIYMNEADRAHILAILKKRGIVSNHQVNLKRFDGEVFDALVTLTLKKDSTGRELIFGRIIDLTSVKRAETLLKKANAELGKKNQELLKTFSELQVMRLQDERRSKELSSLNRELQHANKLLAEMAITDGMTRLYNYRHFMVLLKKEWERAKRNRTNFCVMMIDIDHFKEFNDRWGHQMGDEALKFVARTLRAQTREYDIVARYGGEEFSVVLPDTDLSTCYAVAKRMNQAIEHKTLLVGHEKKKAHLTISVGVSIFLPGEEDPRSYEQLLKDADVALYLAKNQGRNRIEIYRSDLFSETVKGAGDIGPSTKNHD